MTDASLEKRYPGAFQHESFGHKDGWFVLIQALMLLASFLAFLSVGSTLMEHGAGGRFAWPRFGAEAVLAGWMYGLLSVRRWAIAALPFVCWALLLLGLGVAAVGFLSPAPLLPGDPRPIGWFSTIASLLSAALAALALWRMRVPQFREYHRAAIGR